jgi:hypothetical protein
MAYKVVDIFNVRHMKIHDGIGKRKTTYCITFVSISGANITKEYGTLRRRDFEHNAYLAQLKEIKKAREEEAKENKNKGKNEA